MIQLSESMDTYIPLLRYIFEIYDLLETSVKRPTINNKKMKTEQIKNKSKDSKSIKLNSKSINFDVILKVTKEQTNEIDFVQKVIEKLYDYSLYYVTTQSFKLSFPEMVVIFNQKVNYCQI